MDIGKSIGFVFEDEEWVSKILIGGLLGLIPVVNLVTLGYALRTLQNVAAGRDRPLPEWSEFGDFFVKGLLVFIGTLIYSLPAVVLNVTVALAGNLTDAPRIGNVVAVAISGLACLQGLFSLLVALWVPAALTNFARTDDLAAFFRLGEIWGLISRRLGDYVVILLVSVGVSMVAGLVGFVLCIIGLAFTMLIYQLIQAHLLGQWLRQSERPVEAPAA